MAISLFWLLIGGVIGLVIGFGMGVALVCSNLPVEGDRDYK